MICLDEMGPEAATSYPGQEMVRPSPEHGADGMAPPSGRATQEIDDGRRGQGYVFGAFRPRTGDAFTPPYPGRTSVNWVDFLEQVEAWLPAEAEQVYAIVDHLSTHCTTDVLLVSLAHPRWEFVLQPTYAAYLNLIEPWWKILRSLALTGRRFETWDDLCQAIKLATAYWNKHKHPLHWGHRRRHRPSRTSGIALTPSV